MYMVIIRTIHGNYYREISDEKLTNQDLLDWEGFYTMYKDNERFPAIVVNVYEVASDE